MSIECPEATSPASLLLGGYWVVRNSTIPHGGCERVAHFRCNAAEIHAVSVVLQVALESLILQRADSSEPVIDDNQLNLFNY